jgi:hypothetical protein
MLGSILATAMRAAYLWPLGLSQEVGVGLHLALRRTTADAASRCSRVQTSSWLLAMLWLSRNLSTMYPSVNLVGWLK